MTARPSRHAEGVGRVRAWLPSRPQLPYVVVLAGVFLGLIVVGMHHFKRGSVLIAGALVVGAVLRLLLSDRQLGDLAVRTRTIDVVSLGGLGVLLAIAAIVIPPP